MLNSFLLPLSQGVEDPLWAFQNRPTSGGQHPLGFGWGLAAPCGMQELWGPEEGIRVLWNAKPNTSTGFESGVNVKSF